ncbi:ComEA family DNA-binding protein [Micromonospora maritima]|uniref:ComEA family DNA-binding protein n=2 Tax=Micromonospora maritima TaxID=986711 RepID=UPI0031EF3F2F
MPDDEETTVRRRLSRLFTPADRTAVGTPDPDDGGPVSVRATSTAYPRSEPRRGDPGADVGAGRPSGWDRAFVAHGAGEPREDPPEESPAPARGPARLPGPGAFDPGRRGVRALAAVAAVVVLVAAAWAWRSRPHAEPVRPVGGVSGTAGEAPPTGVAAPAGVAASGGVAGQVVVAVAGRVRRPGLVRLPAGSRLADAVEAAGGALPGVDVALLNPARKVTDGELILVGVSAPPGPPAPGPVAGGGAPTGPVNLNTATLAQLDGLPGVGPVLAQRILDHRDQHGGFRSVADLRQVEGIGDARYEQLKELVTV